MWVRMRNQVRVDERPTSLVFLPGCNLLMQHLPHFLAWTHTRTHTHTQTHTHTHPHTHTHSDLSTSLFISSGLTGVFIYLLHHQEIFPTKPQKHSISRC